jgi:hypothetical protein
MALGVARGGLPLNPDSLGAGVSDTDNDGIKEVVDGWRESIRFYRFGWTKIPTAIGMPDLQSHFAGSSVAATAAFTDPLDPRGQLYNWQSAGTNRTAFESLFHRIQHPTPGPNVARYVRPVLVSSGIDRQFGLFTPENCAAFGVSVITTNPANPTIDTPDPVQLGLAVDNIYSFSLRLD